MIPILFDKTTTSFNTNGMGRLSDAISCIVTEERNGAFELSMEYPEGGMHADELETDRIIYAKPAAYLADQPFRIYKITKPLSGKFKVMARHISYDLAYASVMPFADQGSAANALQAMFSNAENIGSFHLGTVTVSTSGTFQAKEPASFRNMMGGKEGSILDVFGGEILWDGFTVSLYASRGTDRGLTLRYGKNISDISQEKDIDYTVTGITPFYKTANDEILTLPEKSVYKQGVSYSTPTRTRVLDCASYIDEDAIREAHPAWTEAQIKAALVTSMRAAAQAYANANLSGVPDATISVSFVDLGSTEEYKGQRSLFAQAGLCDPVKVYYERLGIETTAKIIKTEYNVLLERFEKLTIGKPKSNLAGSLKDIQDSITKAANDASSKISAVREATDQYTDKSIAQGIAEAEAHADSVAQAVANQAAQNLENAETRINSQMKNTIGGYVTLHRDANGNIFEILITDQPDYTQARKVWRWNQGGLAYSSTGYNGTYSEAAITADGTISGKFIVANTLSGEAIIAGTLSAGKITTGVLDATLIKAGVLKDAANKNSINMTTGQFSLANGNFYYSNGSYIELANNLSLRLGGIPLAGEYKTYYNSQSYSDFNWNLSTTIADVVVNIIKYPYQMIVRGHITVKAKKEISENYSIGGLRNVWGQNVIGIACREDDDVFKRIKLGFGAVDSYLMVLDKIGGSSHTNLLDYDFFMLTTIDRYL